MSQEIKRITINGQPLDPDKFDIELVGSETVARTGGDEVLKTLDDGSELIIPHATHELTKTTYRITKKPNYPKLEDGKE